MKDKKFSLIKFIKNKFFFIGIIILIIIICIITSRIGKTKITTKSELLSIVKQNNLHTSEYIYNGIAVQKDENGEDIYYVNYKGTIVAGINLDNLEIEQDNKHKEVIITMPSVEIMENKVDNNIDMLFLKEKYNTETVHVEGYNLAKQDLLTKVIDNTEFMQKAQEKANNIVKAIVEPLIKADGRKYTLVIKEIS